MRAGVPQGERLASGSGTALRMFYSFPYKQKKKIKSRAALRFGSNPVKVRPAMNE